jgi:uncharacterized membrane protein
LGGWSVLTNAAGSTHPPGYYFLLYLWQPLGSSEFALRLPSALFSILALALTWKLAQELSKSTHIAHLATLGMAVAPFQVYYAQDARAYGLTIALSAGITLTFMRSIRRNAVSGWISYSALTLLGLYTHYFIALIALTFHLWLLLNPQRLRTALPALAIADGAIALGFLPQLSQFITETGEFLGDARWRTAPSILEPLRTFYYMVFGHVLPLWLVPIGLFLILSLLAFGVMDLKGGLASGRGLLMLGFIFPILFSLIISTLVTPIYVERSFSVATPALMIWLAWCARAASRHSPAPYLAIALVALMIVGLAFYYLRPDPAKPPLREILAFAEGRRQPGDPVLHLQDASYLPALYYTPERAGELLGPEENLWLPPATYALFGGKVVAPQGYQLPASSGRLWIVMMPGYLDDERREFLESWEKVHTAAQHWDWGSIELRRYELEALR